MITKRDFHVLSCLARYYLLDRRRIQALCFPGDGTGRITRRRLLALCRAKLVSRCRIEIVNPRDGAPAPVYLLARRGREVLAEEFHDDRLLLKAIRPPHRMFFQHALAVAETHIMLDRAVAHQTDDEQRVRLEAWYNETDVLNPDEPDRAKHRRLFTELRQEPRRLVFAPDAAFMLSYRGHKGVFYLEQDRGTSGARQVAAKKAPGSAEFARRALHRKHFPGTTLDRFTILCIAPSPNRRDALQRSLRNKEGAELWRFASTTDLSPDTFLFEPLFRRSDSDHPRPLVRRNGLRLRRL